MRKLEGLEKEILEKARHLLRDDPKSFSIRRIAKECNIGTGTLYNYYQNKDEIVIDLMHEYWSEFLQILKSQNFSGTDELNFKKLFDLFSVYGRKFRFELLNGTNKEVIQKARGLHKEAFSAFVVFIQSIFTSLSFDEAAFIAFNMFAVLTTPGYEFELLERIVFNKLL